MFCGTVLTRLAIFGMVGAGGCVVGPDYERPKAIAPAAWVSPAPDGVTDKADLPSSWWATFHDVELDSLIDRAVRSNLDLQMAQARLRQARAVRGGRVADFAPQVDVAGSSLRQLQSRNQPFFGALALPPNFPFEYNVYQVGFDASWEIDLFGGKRRALEAATADWQGAMEARNDALVSLLAEVARNYVELRGGQQRLQIAQRDVRLQTEAWELTRARFQSGLATELDLTREAALLAAQQATIPPLETTVRVAMYGIAVLLAQSPGDLVAELSSVAQVPPSPPQVPIGLPSDLLRRRPDVRLAERQLAAQTARIGVAKSEWFPKFSLTGDFGSESVSTGNWFAPASRFWSIGPSVQWHLLDFGRVRAQVQAQTAVQEEALANFQKTVLISLREVEDALLAYAQEQIRHRALAEEVANDRRSLDMANSLYAAGRVNFLDVLDVRRSLYQSEDQLAAADQSVSLDLIALYKALGGGWEILPQESARASSTEPPPR